MATKTIRIKGAILKLIKGIWQGMDWDLVATKCTSNQGALYINILNPQFRKVSKIKFKHGTGQIKFVKVTWTEGGSATTGDVVYQNTFDNTGITEVDVNVTLEQNQYIGVMGGLYGNLSGMNIKMVQGSNGEITKNYGFAYELYYAG